MSLVKIRLNTWNRCGNRDTKFKRGIAPREEFVDYNPNTKKIVLKPGEKKWKPWDTLIPRNQDKSYIESKKELYSGLCFENKKQAQEFIDNHKNEFKEMEKQNPLFDHWSIINIISRFNPKKPLIYGKDLLENEIE